VIGGENAWSQIDAHLNDLVAGHIDIALDEIGALYRLFCMCCCCAAENKGEGDSMDHFHVVILPELTISDRLAAFGFKSMIEPGMCLRTPIFVSQCILRGRQGCVGLDGWEQLLFVILR
jgi:hypothetical protein